MQKQPDVSLDADTRASTAPPVRWIQPGSTPRARIAGEVGVLAGRLARYLRESLPDGGQLLSDGRRFLEAAFEAVAEGRPAADFAGGSLQRVPAEVHPLDRLVHGWGLSAAEVDLIMLAGLPEQHEGFAQVLTSLHHRGEPRASVGLAAQLLCEDDVSRHRLRRLLETSPAVTAGVLQTERDVPFFLRDLRLAEGLWPVLNEVDFWPPQIERLQEPVSLFGLEQWLTQPLVAQALTALRRASPCTVLVTDDDLQVAFFRGTALAMAADLQQVQVHFPPTAGDSLQRLLQVHAMARGMVPVVRLTAADGPGVAAAPALADFPGPLIVCARAGHVAMRGPRPVIGVTCERLRPAELARMWARTLPALADEAPQLAARYPLEPAAALQVAGDLRHMEQTAGRQACSADVSASVRVRAGSTLRGGVALVQPAVGWERLVLPPERSNQLREAANRLTHQVRVLDQWRFLQSARGARGVRMLFAGPPGTGKTLAAEVMAHTLQVDLLVVDLSRVVSKWIGETEKNLADVFETAERCRAVLLFDEADALFGKRTEVSDAHDRYANLETAYLLARLERFEGLAILSTNLRQNIDAAFSRRLEFVVEFAAPNRDQRLALWRCHLPDTAPLAADVNLNDFATTYPIVGGLIRNAAVAAAFLAAADDTEITRAHFVSAIRREYEKSGKAFPGLPTGMSEFESR